MSEPDLFESENSALAGARAVFGDPRASAEAYRRTLGELIGHYERLMRETRRLIRRSDREELEMNRLNQRLQELARELAFRATRDTLTGALNRGAVIEQAGMVLAGGSMALIVLDIDHFKRVNDTLGHPVGDAVIRGITDCLAQAVLDAGTVGRMGGEEFAALLPARSLAAAMELADRIRLRIAACVFAEAPGLQVTASFGVSWNPRGTSFEHAYGRADEALYEAKRSGRNRVVCALAPEPVLPL
ncbi:GGDEF domain-containing protein [Cupriavidus sp. 2TAF22]|uniref:GGDEF domain-containing protein n=1 Tax=unclassified Cupriavidus TaxID=2640874 RepID=UPI003F92C7FF